MIKKLFFACSIILAITLQNCKDGGEPEPAPITAPELIIAMPLPSIDGILAASITVTKSGGVESKIGTAHAMFYKSKNPATKVEAGTVKINTKTTTKADDNTYFYGVSATEPKGLEYQSQVFWDVIGSTANDVPRITNNDNSGLPNMPSLPEFANYNTNQDGLITWTNSSGADSVILIFKGPSATYKKVFNNSIVKHTVPKAEIAKLGIGSGTIQVINYKMEVRVVDTKNYAFIKQTIAICSKVGIKI